jgi:hypothetical protein
MDKRGRSGNGIREGDRDDDYNECTLFVQFVASNLSNDLKIINFEKLTYHIIYLGF